MYADRIVTVNRLIFPWRVMVTTESTPQPYVTIARNGRSAIQLDAPSVKGGSGEAMRRDIQGASMGSMYSKANPATARMIPTHRMTRVDRLDPQDAQFGPAAQRRGRR